MNNLQPFVNFKGSLVFTKGNRTRIKYRGLALIKDSFEDIIEELKRIYYIEKIEMNSLTENILLIHEFGIDLDELLAAVDNVFSGYSLEAYKKYLEIKSKQEKAMESEGELSSRILTGRLVVSTGMILYSTIRNKLRQNPLIMTESAEMSMVSKFTTAPAIVSLFLTAPLVKSALKGIVEEKRPNADFLTVSSIIASIMLGNSISALTIIALSDVAELMTAYTMEKTRKSIKELLSIDQEYVWKMDELGNPVKTKIEAISKDDDIMIQIGEKISVDGEVVSGEAIIDQSSITGEYMPVVKKTGDKIFAGGIIKNGSVVVKAEKVGDETVISRIIDLVENSAAVKAPIQAYADKFSNYLVTLNFLLSGMVYLTTKNTTKALNMMVIDYSCGIKLSTATAFSAAINSAVKKGILIKGGAFIEQMSSIDTIVFDKTGTITEGRPRVVEVVINDKNMTEHEVISLACAAEETSSHPLASSVLEYGKLLGVEIPEHDEIVTVVARGTHTTVTDKGVVRVGNLAFMRENSITVPKRISDKAKGYSPIYVALDKKFLGLICTLDKTRRNFKRTVNMLRGNGINEVVMLTGDTEDQAKQVARYIYADTYKAELLPEEKADHILKLKSEGTNVIMVGDGINDAPALSYANVGISLGSKSTDIAMETSDIVINSDEPMMIPRVLKMSNHTMDIVKQNFALVISINTVGLILGAATNLSVFWSAVLHNMSTIFVVGNSVRLLFYDMGVANE